MRLTVQLFIRKFPKSSFRRPMEGRGLGREKTEKGFYLWPLSFNELDEEVMENGRSVPKRDRIPQIMVPDLKNSGLKPYVTYTAEDVFEPPMQSKDFFDMFYAPAIEAEAKSIPLEDIPSSETRESKLSSFFAWKK